MGRIRSTDCGRWVQYQCTARASRRNRHTSVVKLGWSQGTEIERLFRRGGAVDDGK